MERSYIEDDVNEHLRTNIIFTLLILHSRSPSYLGGHDYARTTMCSFPVRVLQAIYYGFLRPHATGATVRDGVQVYRQSIQKRRAKTLK